ncbi:MAG: hypothetical protein JRN45_09120 [Nitrososphaerota archaeon]|nr:hypothetical protein [Nitrososphaerota archaeon]
MSAQEIASLASKAARPLVFGFVDLTSALRVGAQMLRLPGGPQGVKFYLKFANRVNLEEMHALGDLASKGISILWDPYVTRDIAVIGGVRYALEKEGLRSLGPARFSFKKAGFFDVMWAKAVRAQKLRESSGLVAMLILEREEGKTYPLFLAAGTLPHDLRSGDTVEVAYFSVVGERTLAGSPAPAEVFLEAIAVELLHSSLSHLPLTWVSAHEKIDGALSDFEPPPTGGSKKTEAWKKAAKAAVTSSIRKEMIYLEWEDERYIYGEMERRAADAAKKQTGQHHWARKPA